MTVAIDTSSLIYLIRYYLKFDKDGKLFRLFKQKIENREIVLIHEVLEECEYTAKKIVVETFTFLVDKEWNKQHKVIVKTNAIIPPSSTKFHNIIDNQMINARAKREFSDEEYEIAKARYLKSADARLILFGLDYKSKNKEDEFYIVTEESDIQNDNKAFKKIPTFGTFVGIEAISIADLIDKYPEITLSF